MSEYGDYIDLDGCCTACGNAVDLGEFHWGDFQADDGGVQPGTPHGPPVHWATGTIPCEHCGARLFMEAVSP